MDVRMPDGTIISNVPEGVTKSQLMGRYEKSKRLSALPQSMANIQADQASYSPEDTSLNGQLARQAGLTLRMGADTVAALPLAALEGGAAVGNLVSGGDVSPRRTYEQGINQFLPQPSGLLEKGVQFVGDAVLGSRMPVPTPKSGVAPEGFKTASEMATEAMAQKVKSAQELGYVIPPATSNPGGVTKTAEGVAGKLSTAQLASANNMQVTNAVAARALGLSEDTPLTLGAVRAVRNEAGQAYEAVRGIGTINLGPGWNASLDAAEAATKGANRAFPGLTKDNPLLDHIAALRQPNVNSSDAVDTIKVLREYADEAGAKGARHVAGTYRKLATELENSIDDQLAQGGPSPIISAFRQARQLIAKTYTIEKAMNKGTGEVSAVKLGQQLDRGVPLTGELKQVAEFAKAFPKAARPFNESLPGISPLDFYAAGGTAALSAALTGGNPAAVLPLAYPFIRQGTRNALLSQFGQQLAVPTVSAGANPQYVMGATNALIAPR